jgi:hypothetical protein
VRVQPKTFAIGVNKTASPTMHKSFGRDGYRLVHWAPAGQMLAQVVVTNVLNDQPLLAPADQLNIYFYFAYCDGKASLEADYFFRDLHRAYPDADFVLTTRPVKK